MKTAELDLATREGIDPKRNRPHVTAFFDFLLRFFWASLIAMIFCGLVLMIAFVFDPVYVITWPFGCLFFVIGSPLLFAATAITKRNQVTVRVLIWSFYGCFLGSLFFAPLWSDPGPSNDVTSLLPTTLAGGIGGAFGGWTMSGLAKSDAALVGTSTLESDRDVE